MLGTAGNLLVPRASPGFDARLIQSHAVGSDGWLSLGGTLCGAALEWFRRVFAPGVPWEALEAEAAAVDADASGLLFVPYLQGERTPIWDESARATIAGLDLSHGRAHVLRALMEGIALGFRDCMLVAEEGGVRFGGHGSRDGGGSAHGDGHGHGHGYGYGYEIVATDGAGKSALLRQTLADALGVPVAWSSGGGGTLEGAAMLAGLAAGVFPTARSAADAFAGARPARIRHAPDPRAQARLRRALERRRALRAVPSGAATM
jgi:xylulokinase